MTELELYKFITENNVEWHKIEDDMYIMPNLNELKDFHDICDPTLFDDDGIECIFKDGYLVIKMEPICNHYDIDIDSVFTKDNWDD